MNFRLGIIFPILIVSFFIFSLAYSQNKFKLKPKASGEICLKCHVDFEEKLKNPFVHTPVKTEECTGCHNPHASAHGKLLAEDVTKLCFKCHPALKPEKVRSVHKIVAEGNCLKCHESHASKNKFNLLKGGNELCFGCHKNIGDRVAKVKFKHNPVEKGCSTCHDPHASAKSDHLLKNNLVSLCLDCHKADRPNFTRQHMNYPVANANCTSCHNPHGSDREGLLFDNVHTPVANRMCNQCHEAPTSPTPFKTKKVGLELCRGCHSSLVNEAFNKNRIHWPLVDRVGCLNCHQPHASTQKKLLKGDMASLCGKCHADTIERQEKAMTKHAPIQEGNCTSCHAAHASDSVLLLNQPSTINLCGTCHEWLKHTTHPIGEKILDPRNKNLMVQCLSCHRSHGTSYKYMLPFPTVTDLCIQCHKKFTR